MPCAFAHCWGWSSCRVLDLPTEVSQVLELWESTPAGAALLECKQWSAWFASSQNIIWKQMFVEKKTTVEVLPLN